MSMKVCKECGHEISKKAKACPACGAKNKKPIYKRIWIWVLVVLVVIGIALGGGDSTPAQTEFGMNEPYSVTDETIVVTKEADIEDEFGFASEGTDPIKIWVEYSNTGDMDAYITSTEFKLYADGQLCNEYIWEVDNAFPLVDTITPGRNAAGWICYEVPDNAEKLELEYHSVYSSDIIIFHID